MDRLVKEIKEAFKEYVVGIKEQKEKNPEYEDFKGFFNSELINKFLESLNIRLYKHQTLALESLYKSNNVVLTTPTASGKSEVFRLFIIDNLLKDKTSTFLLIYPMRALLYDQYEKLVSRIKVFEEVTGVKINTNIGIILGDLSYKEKEAVIKNKPNIILTTIDNLHLFLLRNHHKMFYFFKGLKLVVIDEIHSYRGVFGTNSAYVFRRLFRVLDYIYKNKNYRILALSATLKNSKDFCKKLTGKEFIEINKDYSKRFKRVYIAIDPKYRSPRLFLKKVIEILYKNDIKSLVFLESKKGVELSSIESKNIDKSERIQPYKASFPREIRRDLEKKFKNNEILILITTSALELGIDIGDVEAIVNYGIPKDGMFSLIQRIGRAGRNSDGYAIILFKKDALDFYYSLNKSEFFDRLLNNKIDDLPVRLDNEKVVKKHLIYSLKEVGKLTNDMLNNIEQEYMSSLIKDGFVEVYKDPFYGKKYYKLLKDIHYSGIRSISDNQYFLIDYDSELERVIKRIKNPAKARNFLNLLRSRNKVIEELDEEAFYDYVLPGMVYYSMGKQYRIKTFYNVGNIYFILAEKEDYYSETFPLVKEDVEILNIDREKKFGDWVIKLGDIKVKKLYIGYIEKFKYGEDIEYKTEYYDNPISREFETKSVWIEIPQSYRDVCKDYLEYFKRLLEKMDKKIDFNFLMNLASSIDRDFLYEKYRGFTSKKIYEILSDYLRRFGVEDKRIIFIAKKFVDYFHCFQSGLHAIEHNIIKISPTVTNIDSREIGGYSYPIHQQTGKPTIFIYEGYQGGVGLSEIIFENIEDLIRKSKKSLYKCKCKDGCPRCVLSSKCGNFNEYLDKYAGRFIYRRFFYKY